MYIYIYKEKGCGKGYLKNWQYWHLKNFIFFFFEIVGILKIDKAKL